MQQDDPADDASWLEWRTLYPLLQPTNGGAVAVVAPAAAYRVAIGPFPGTDAVYVVARSGDGSLHGQRIAAT